MKIFKDDGYPYYFNVSTQETVWELPPGVVSKQPPPPSDPKPQNDELKSSTEKVDVLSFFKYFKKETFFQKKNK